MATDAASRRARLRAARLYLVVTPEALGPAWPRALEAALATGLVDMVQLREKALDDDAFLARARALAERAHAHGALLVLNDRVHLVAEAGADGAHVGEDDLPPEVARARLGPDLLLGLSTHDEREVAAAAARGADHVGLGPCYPTGSKALARPTGGPDLVRRCLAHAGDLPVFPIGGVTPENAALLVAAGARRLAVGAGVLGAPDPAAAARRIHACLARAG